MTNLRITPRFSKSGRFFFRITHWMTTRLMRLMGYHAVETDVAQNALQRVKDKLARGEVVYLCGIGAAGLHNTGVALVEVTSEYGPRLIANNEEERFSGDKHTLEYPEFSIKATMDMLEEMGLGVEDIDAWLTTWDYPALIAMGVRSMVEEFPATWKMLKSGNKVAMDMGRVWQMLRAPKRISEQLGLSKRLDLVLMPHHHNHAWYSFAVSPFDDTDESVAVAVLDGTGDNGSVSLFSANGGNLEQLYTNDSLFDSLGAFYSVIASTQGGWTWLSCEGRYMGASAWGDTNRETNRFFKPLRSVLHFGPEGTIKLNRALARWHSDMFEEPYSKELIELIGRPLQPHELWNPDAVLKVEDIKHAPNTQERLDKAAATQMVFEDALIHVLEHLFRQTGAHRLVMTGGVALNALANMRILEHFDKAWFKREQDREVRLHLWVPPTPGDAGVTIGAAWWFAHLAGVGRGIPISHAFYCGSPPSTANIIQAINEPDIETMQVGNISTQDGLEKVADLMARAVAQDCVIALYQGAAETGPRALGHRSIFANPVDQDTRERLNARVKHREAIRPLAPMATLEAAHEFFNLLEGASDADYNVYNYMVLTARAKPHAIERIPSVIHADGTGRIQIVRQADDPLTYAYLKALGRHIGVELSVNTSFNVAGPIVQTPEHAIETLRRAKGLDAVLLVGNDGIVNAAWNAGERNTGRFSDLFNN